MKSVHQLLLNASGKPIYLLEAAIPLDAYTPLDLSTTNPDLALVAITDPIACQDYIDTVLQKSNARVAYGGYLEKRDLYGDKENFNGNSIRNIHLGVDFWAPAGTKVMAPLAGKVHSFQNNDAIGDYGPTIILEHRLEELVLYSLYGHLSLASLEGLSKGQLIEKGEVLGTLGTSDINVNYAPHLHFQLILDMEGKEGNYPGVCDSSSLDFYVKNCPDPQLLLGY